MHLAASCSMSEREHANLVKILCTDSYVCLDGSLDRLDSFPAANLQRSGIALETPPELNQRPAQQP